MIIMSLFISTAVNAAQIDQLNSAYQMLEVAKNQTELNKASQALLRAWRIELNEKVQEMAIILPKGMMKKFKRSMNLWEKHAEDMSRMRSDLFKRNVSDPFYMRLKGIKGLDPCAECSEEMSVYVYNMSMSIYYEEKWTELDILINHN